MKRIALAVLASFACLSVVGAGTWEQEAKLVPADGQAHDAFGSAVAFDGDRALVAAVYDDDNGSNSGSAYVFTRAGGAWTEEAKLLPADGAEDDWFGFNVALDGDTALLGAVHDDDLAFESGSAYVFTRTGGVWIQQAKLLPADGATEEYFGCAVTLDGDTAVVGAYDQDNGLNSGSAYVFTRAGDEWTQRAKLLPADAQPYQYFGSALALDGDILIVGAYGDEDNGGAAGAAYVFMRTAGVWTQQAKLLASDGDAVDYFGGSLALDGDTAIIGASADDDNGDESGSAYVFQHSAGVWTQAAKLRASDGADGDRFGAPIALDGDTALIGARSDDDNGQSSGSAYYFTREWGVWAQQAKLLPDDGEANDQFGRNLALQGDTAVIGARWNHSNAINSGSAYVFRLSPDDDVPAVGGYGTALIVLALLGTTAYFVRRRGGTPRLNDSEPVYRSCCGGVSRHKREDEERGAPGEP
jgi:hypothetical protein